MGLLVLLGLIAIPLLDIASLIQAGAVFGFWPTLVALLLAGLSGSWLIGQQRLAAVKTAQASLDAGRFPADAVFDGVCLLLAGGLLLFPGFVSDVLAALLLIPPIRRALQRWLGQRLVAHGSVRVWTPGEATRSREVVIDGDFEIVPAEESSTQQEPAGVLEPPATKPLRERPSSDTGDT